jgi:hypothetical protein
MFMNRFVNGAIALAAVGVMSVTGMSGVTAQDAGLHPAHIHAGSCPNPGDVVVPLSDVSTSAMNNGTPMAMDMVGSDTAIPALSSVTTVDLALADIVAGEHSINVHQSADDMGTYIACGDIGGMMIGDSDLLFGIGEQNGSGLNGVGSLHDNGDGTTTVYVYLSETGAMSDATPMGSPADHDGMDMGTPES